MKIVIIGAGIAGLTTYLHLQKHLPDTAVSSISILERHVPSKKDEDASIFRGGMAIGPNGMRVLRRLNQSIYSEIRKNGFPCQYFTFRTAGGFPLGSWHAATARPTKEETIMIDRSVLWDIVRRKVPDNVLRNDAGVIQIKDDGSVILENGETLNADLVIGADGVWSIARKCVIDEGEEGHEPVFQALMSIGGAISTKALETHRRNTPSTCVMTFGKTGFVGYTPITSAIRSDPEDQTRPDPGPTSMWWATYSEDSATASRKTSTFPTDPKLRTAFKQRHGDWADPAIRHIAQALKQDHEPLQPDIRKRDVTLNLCTPTWIIPKLKRWTRGRVILIGDAAHALPSTSGQGISQVLEDAAALSLILARAWEQSEENQRETMDPAALSRALGDFERMRKPRVERILDEAMQMQHSKREMGGLELLIMYVVMFVIFRFVGMHDEWKLEYGVEEALGEESGKKMSSESRQI